ncbi:MAG: formate-dependent phosphoribosylglycinamide formyltransferase [Nitrospirae bacterium]|nr:formate-dependent phosphoribosylglycinamide formyltransferase [Nitrospirota bacterium]MBI3595031.1 formate-dependent phosphoribosylglycinamide formyltransferase [Nitrospirota bacterium]
MIGTPFSGNAKRLLLLGAGELGKEIAIEAQRFGVEVIAVDRYANAPAMQIAHRSHVIDMLNRNELSKVIELENPDFVVPEIEAIATDYLLEIETAFTIIPTARAARLTMDREGIRKLAAEELKLPTSRFTFIDEEKELVSAADTIGYPCVMKPVMSSSGKGQSVIKNRNELHSAWEYAMAGARAKNKKVILESFIPFDYEITLLTVRGVNGTVFCSPIGHIQIDGDYRQSWQPHPMSPTLLTKCREIAKVITDHLGGRGIFGVELFVQGGQVYFSEVSPRPHDTGLVTLVTQDLSEFALHVRAILGFPVFEPQLRTPGGSAVILADEAGVAPQFEIDEAMKGKNTQIRLFGKPDCKKNRRMGVILVSDSDPMKAAKMAKEKASMVKIHFGV